MTAMSVLRSAAVAAAGVSVLGAVYATGRASTLPALAAARRLARTDALTGVANRAGLGLDLARRAGGSESWALVLVDLDNFKQVNDTHGHAVGDAVLIEAARRLVGVSDPARDLVARLGGDEFVLAVDSPAGAISWLIAQDAATVLRRPMMVHGRRVEVTASVGMVHALPGDSPRAVLHSADHALYEAKTHGRDRVVEFDPTAELVDVTVERPAGRLRELTAAGRDLAGVAS